jgi:hypothetical protein
MESNMYQEQSVNNEAKVNSTGVGKADKAKKRGASSSTVTGTKVKEGNTLVETTEEQAQQLLGMLNLPTGYASVAASVADLNNISLKNLLTEIISCGLEPYAAAIKTFRQKQSEQETLPIN